MPLSVFLTEIILPAVLGLLVLSLIALILVRTYRRKHEHGKDCYYVAIIYNELISND